MSLTVAIEKSLLIGKWDTEIPKHQLSSLSKDVVDGSFKGPLTSPYAQELFKIDPSDSLDQPLRALFAFSLPLDFGAEPERELVRLTLAVACLHAFVQANWTGPDLEIPPLQVVPAAPDGLTEQVLNAKAISELAFGGEPAYHLARAPAFLRLAQLLFALPYRHCQSVPWWRLRTVLVHQQVLDEPVALPADILASLGPLTGIVAQSRDLAGRLLLKQGLLEHHFSHDKSAAEYFVRAAKATGLEYELTGALGKRTKFQQTDLSQLVLLAESHLTEDGSEAENAPAHTPAHVPNTLVLNDDTLLEQTSFTSSLPTDAGSRLGHIDPAAQPALHPLDQCILLSLCLNVKNTSPSHGLTAEQMSPYVARVISHPRNWSVHTMALLLRSRLESSRTRTIERSTLQLQALIDQMPTADSALSERLLYFHAIPLPSKWEMERELALRFLSLGVVKSALEIFERLEMWEEVVKCWQAMEREDRAVDIVRDLLEGRKQESDVVLLRGKDATRARRHALDTTREAKFWCLLGDLEPAHAPEHYTRAWTLSRETSGRAMRSLGGYHFARGDFAKAVPCLRRAVAINPLLSRTWFILGCACVRLETWEGAREAFSRCVAIDDEDGESWSNLASVYLRMTSAPSHPNNEGELGDQIHNLSVNDVDETASRAVPFTNKILAFRALKQGLKFSYDNWRMWSNYMVVAMDVGELSEACRALARVVEETSARAGAEAVDEDVLDRLVDAVTRGPTSADGGGWEGEAPPRHPNDGHGLPRSVQDLLERTVLPRVSSPRVFRAYARLLTWQARWDDALKAYLDGYRCGAAGVMERGEMDVERWREAVSEVEEIVEILRNFGPRVDSFKWRLQGRSIVRTFIGRTEEFEDEPERARLTELLEELRREE